MEASELRIGNFVEYNGFVRNIVSLNLGTEVNALPIPLTEEWLLKFGFIKVLDYPCFRLEGLQIEFNGFDSQWGSGLLDEKTVIKYVHQLQNLFFALKGKELTIKN
ncbi:hypothetical protein JOE44_001934 [Chryseobacterium sp. PvR013]|uniref:hypothetical protein n=1 Tax=Chryseobacterium sp. PvR013 TaxID=2806595 RepID=UPI001AE62874|nr:hypothetical protein [Chryseobacterium sp. PvR013]MBP1165050.1 hypothetical protein [Chryseobacterium sp. PvR013]